MESKMSFRSDFLGAAVLLAIALVSAANIHAEVTLGTAFTYQGQLKKDGAPLNGTCDLQLSLWDALAGGLQLGQTRTLANVNVTNGLFAASVDFGQAAFNGNARWLAISVRCPAGSGGYQLLTPRQPISATPYALVSLQATGLALPISATVNSASNALSISNTGSGKGIHASSTDDYAVHGQINSPSFAGVAGINTSTGPGVYAASANGNAVDAFNTTSGVMAGLGGSVTAVYGGSPNYASYFSGGNYAGYFTSPVFAGYFTGGGNLIFTGNGKMGVGTDSPQDKLEVSDGLLSLDSGPSGSLTGIKIRENDAQRWTLLYRTWQDDDLEIYDEIRHKMGMIFKGDSGKVGVNTDSPSEELEVAGNLEVSNPAGTKAVRVRTSGDALDFDYSGANMYMGGAAGNVAVMRNDVRQMDVNGALNLTGAFRGNISSNTGSDGAPFPRPAFNSGWWNIAPDELFVLTHNIGGSVDDYFMDLQAWNSSWNIHNYAQGGEVFWDSNNDVNRYHGLTYNLNNSTITIQRNPNDNNCPYFRVRIWVIK